MDTFRDKVVLITGASSGIGRATALRLAGAGARLALAARTEAALHEVARQVEAAGGQALVVATDVSSSEQCCRAVETAVERFGRLDALICSAGISLRAPFADADLEVLERVMRVNFFGTLYATYHAIPHVKRTRGSLVAISSLTGKRGTPSYVMYGASKFAIQGLYQGLRIELANDGVHVGIVAPGFVDTPLRQRVMGPDGKPWPEQPSLPFRLWPLERCVDCIVKVLQRRKAEVLLPPFVRPFLALDEAFGSWMGDWYLSSKFRWTGPRRPERTGPENGAP
jgi:NAD(P)-dependent dehydrogenase (short-subunit alcohol dehydrogenase family)